MNHGIKAQSYFCTNMILFIDKGMQETFPNAAITLRV